MKVRVEVEVSWPANISVITWSRISRSVNPSPSSSRAVTSRLRMSRRPGSGSARRRAISPKTISSRTAREAIILRQGEPGPAQQPQGEVDPVVAERALEVLGRGGALAGLVGVEPEQRPHRDPHRQVRIQS